MGRVGRAGPGGGTQGCQLGKEMHCPVPAWLCLPLSALPVPFLPCQTLPGPSLPCLVLPSPALPHPAWLCLPYLDLPLPCQTLPVLPALLGFIWSFQALPALPGPSLPCLVLPCPA